VGAGRRPLTGKLLKNWEKSFHPAVLCSAP